MAGNLTQTALARLCMHDEISLQGRHLSGDELRGSDSFLSVTYLLNCINAQPGYFFIYAGMYSLDLLDPLPEPMARRNATHYIAVW